MKTWIAMAALSFLITIIALEAPAGDAPTVTRSKKIDFEDNVVEGLNKNPLDSIEHLAKQDGKDRPRLYRKRRTFKKEMGETAREMGNSP